MKTQGLSFSLERKIGGAILNKICKGLIVFTIIGITAGCEDKNETFVKEEISRTGSILNQITGQLNSLRRNLSPDVMKELMATVNSSSLDINDYGYALNPEQRAAIDHQKAVIDSVRRKTEELCEEFLKSCPKTIVCDDILVEKQYVQPMYLKKGATLYLNFENDGPVTVNLYNANSKKLLKSYKQTSVADEILISNTAIYLLEFNTASSQYCNVNIATSVNSLQDYNKDYEIKCEQVETTAGAFRAKKVPGIIMKPIFEEPHKMTIRSIGKHLWELNSPYRTVAAVKVPSGATDILYHLRISSDDCGRSSDGQFVKDVESKYRKIKFLGLPLYESNSNSSSIFRELLNGISVEREEKAYCNLYVFTNSAQAKKFLDNGDIEKLSYNVDYSASGTQSRNERIPTKGFQTIYLGFENPRQLHDIYLWLEVLATVPTSIYYTDVYSID